MIWGGRPGGTFRREIFFSPELLPRNKVSPYTIKAEDTRATRTLVFFFASDHTPQVINGRPLSRLSVKLNNWDVSIRK